MKTIQEAALELHEKTMFKSDLSTHPTAMFEAAVKFAEEFLPIERGDDGWITDEQQAEMVLNIPFLTKDKEGEVDLFYTVDWTILDDVDVTHWRPINRK